MAIRLSPGVPGASLAGLLLVTGCAPPPPRSSVAQSKPAPLVAADAPPKGLSSFELYNAGRELTAQAARGLEQQVLVSPEDTTSRVQLLGYYTPERRAESTEDRASYLSHVTYLAERDAGETWLVPFMVRIRSDVDGQDAFLQVKEALERACADPSAPAHTFALAADVLQQEEPRAAEDLLEAAVRLYPGNPDLWSRLADVYGEEGGERRDATREVGFFTAKSYWAARKGLDVVSAWRSEFDDLKAPTLGLHLTTGQDKSPLDTVTDERWTQSQEARALQQTTPAAFAAGDVEGAGKFARELLNHVASIDGDTRELARPAHIVLGRLALRRGQIADARDQLLQASGGGLDWFRLDRRLAEGLIASGETGSVARYVGADRTFVASGRKPPGNPLDFWTSCSCRNDL
jgi:hypothetical protein